MVDDERGWNIEREIREMAEIIFLEKSNEPLSELGTYTPEQIQEISSNVREYSKCIKRSPTHSKGCSTKNCKYWSFRK